MAHYYSALVRTVSRLANNDPEARQQLYEHARSNIVAQLHIRDLRISEQEVTNERAELERAIHRVEAETLSTQADARGGLTRPTDAGVPAPTSYVRREAKSENIGAMPEWLAATFLGAALVAGLIAIAGLLYLAFD